MKTRKYLNVVHSDVHGMHTNKCLYLDNYIHCLALKRMVNDGKCNGYYSMVIHPSFPFVSLQLVCLKVEFMRFLHYSGAVSTLHQ